MPSVHAPGQPSNTPTPGLAIGTGPAEGVTAAQSSLSYTSSLPPQSTGRQGHEVISRRQPNCSRILAHVHSESVFSPSESRNHKSTKAGCWLHLSQGCIYLKVNSTEKKSDMEFEAEF